MNTQLHHIAALAVLLQTAQPLPAAELAGPDSAVATLTTNQAELIEFATQTGLSALTNQAETSSLTNLPDPSGNDTNFIRVADPAALESFFSGTNRSGIGAMTNENLITSSPEEAFLQEIHARFELARTLRLQQNNELAQSTLVRILETNAPEEMKRKVLLELAMIAQDMGDLVRAVQIFGQYTSRYAEDPAVPEILLRQGVLYRKIGVPELAIAKFYSVMTSALTLRLGELEYYKHLVLQAQTEIADTYYLDGRYQQASEFLRRLLKLDTANLNKSIIHYKLIRSLGALQRHTTVIAESEKYLIAHPDSPEVPEVRFLFSNALKQVGRDHEAMQQVLLLLESQQASARENPENWIYWQQRAGNNIANQLYKEGDFVSALEIYLSLAALDPSALWQVPVWYQIGLVYERLNQLEKAREYYENILARQPELPPERSTAAMKAVFEMAEWRAEFISWLTKAETASAQIMRQLASTNQPSVLPIP